MDESLRAGRWAAIFPSPRDFRFEGGRVLNAYCPDCRLCCGPQEEKEPFPMALLDRQVSERTPNDFHLLDPRTACLDGRGCKSLGPSGCRLETELRPLACGIFPYVLAELRLYLYLPCPASLLLERERLRLVGDQVFAWLSALPRAELERISISRRPEDLRERYLDLGLGFQGSGALDEASGLLR